MITAFNSMSDTKIYIPCSNCRKPHEISLAAFIVAINRESLLECVHCKETFVVELRCLTRAAQHRNEAEAGGGTVEGNEECGNCGTFRTVRNGVIEKCSNCGDDEIELGAVADVIP